MAHRRRNSGEFRLFAGSMEPLFTPWRRSASTGDPITSSVGAGRARGVGEDLHGTVAFRELNLFFLHTKSYMKVETSVGKGFVQTEKAFSCPNLIRRCYQLMYPCV